jgi:transglutaminase-like putative cysteine protease
VSDRLAAPARYAEACLCAGTTAAAGLLYAGFFAGSGYLAPILAAAAGGTLVAAVAAARRWRPWLTLAAAAGGFALLAGFWLFRHTLRHGLPTAQTGTELGLGLIRGWRRMLTVGLPADVTGELLVTPVLLSWAAAFAAVSLALRGRSVLAPAGPPLAAFVAGLLLVASRPGHHLVPTAAFLVGTLLLLLLRANRVESPDFAGTVPREVEALGIDWHGQQRRATLMRIARGVPLVAVVAVLGTAAAQASPLARGEDRFDPRELHPPRLEVDDTVTPLATLKRQLRENPPRTLFTMRLGGPGAARTDRVRVAVLDRFDGALWSSADRFLVAGRVLARDPALTRAQPVTEHVELADLPGPFLPAAGRPVRLDPADGAEAEVWFSEHSGALVTDAGSLRGFSYDLTAEVRPPDAELALARPAALADGHRDAAVSLPPGVPPEITALAERIAGRERTPYQRLTAIEQHLRRLPYSLDALPGHSYGALARMLDGAQPGDAAGYAEQHAAAFAVLARAMALPARVAVGYRLRPSDGGVHRVTTADAHAWPEVALDGYGWMPFEPTDTTNLPAQPRPPEPLPGPGAAAVPGPDNPRPPRVVPPPALTAPVPGNRSGDDSVGFTPAEAAAAVLWGVLLGAGLAAGGAALVVAEKARRRWRRRRATGRAGCLAAWREMTDRLVGYGVPVPPALTADEVAARAAAALGPASAAVGRLAPVATAALYAPYEPDAAAVRRAWQLETQLRHDLRTHRGRTRRVRAALDPRPLFGRRRRKVQPGRWRSVARLLGERVTS